MKAFYTTILAVVWALTASAQQNIFTENFDQLTIPTSFEAGPTGSWEINTGAVSVTQPDERYLKHSNGPVSDTYIRFTANTTGMANINMSWFERKTGNAKLVGRGFRYSINNGSTWTVVYTAGNPDPKLTPSGDYMNDVTTWVSKSVSIANGSNATSVIFEWAVRLEPGNSRYNIDGIRLQGNKPTITFTELTTITPTKSLVLEAPLKTPALKAYTVSGTNLLGPINILATTTTSPEKFRISFTESYTIANYSTSLTTVNPDANGNLASTTIWVLYLGSETATTTETFKGNLAHTSPGVSESVALEGITNPNPPAPFPVELATFKGQVSNGTTNLLWVTASEKNNEKFVVERSQNGRDYISVGEVKGSGNSSTKISYSFKDVKPAFGTNYYRLRQTDFDGTISYSNVIALQVAGSMATSVYPTVASNAVTISLQNTSGKATIYITDITGKTVATFNSTTLQEVELPVQNFKSGMYFVRVTDGQNQQVQRFIKE